jgi:NAD+ synthase (glutamine-hydrolysing)
MKNNQFVKVSCVSPKLVVGKPLENVKYFIEEINKIQDQNPEFILFPELATTGYTIGDLIFQTYVIKQSNEAIHYFLKHNPSPNIVIFGAPISYRDQLYNCAVVVHKDKVLGIIPKMYLPNYNEFYEKRYFVSGIVFNHEAVHHDLFDAPFGSMLFNEQSKDITFGVEVCEDLHAPIAPGSLLAINGAEIIFNLSASNEVLDKDELRRYLTQGTSRRNHTAYVYASSGRYESTQDTVFSGHNLIVEDGKILAESELFTKDSKITMADIDLGYLKFRRLKSSTLKDSLMVFGKKFYTVKYDGNHNDQNFNLIYPLGKTPFVPTSNLKLSFNKILNIQKSALAKRVEHTGVKTLLIGLSGGLDSTLALLVACETYQFLGRDPKDIIAITMPGFGTSDRTFNNANALAKELGITFDTISIKDSVLAHFKAIKHDPEIKDVTYENAQARERTAILMNLANKHHGLVVGTGDLSELALGWATFNGDHMSNYGVNAGIPKTLVKFMVKAFADYHYHNNQVIKDTLYDILDTPISPELAGSNNDQKTEDIIGKYEVNDFIIYRMLVRGDHEERIKYLLSEVFKDDLTNEEIDGYLSTFYRRFYTQQFKRSTLPDGPKVVDISLSPRSDFRMPSDAGYEHN